MEKMANVAWFAPPSDALRDIDESLFEHLPLELARRYCCLPMAIDAGVFWIAAETEQDIYLQLRLEALAGEQVVFKAYPKQTIDDALDYWSGRIDQLQNMTEEMGLVKERGDREVVESLETIEDPSLGPIVRLINTIIITGLQKRASDVHIEMYERNVSIKYRVDGALIPAMADLDPSYHSALLSRLKVMAELDIAEKRVPQDGRFKLRINRREIDFRLSVLPGLYGENAVVRILDHTGARTEFQVMSLDQLGMSIEQRKVFEKAIHEPYGMVLMTGPTGSGKTTTLYTALSAINSGEVKIITIEDPVEYNLGGITQIPVNVKKGLTFATGLRSILRHDPDKILVGEIRDGETADIAIQSALTGHLVFSSVHANSAVDVLARLQNMGIDAHNCLSALNCVIAQRLVRLICPACKAPVEYAPDFLLELGLDETITREKVFYRGKGCEECNHTGYFGRAMICEVLEVTKAVREAILENRTVVEAISLARVAGDVSLRQSSLSRVYAGETTLEEINRVTFVD